MLRLLHILTDCFVVPPRNDDNSIRHCEPTGLSNLYVFAKSCLFAIFLFLLSNISSAQTSIKIGFLIRDKNDIAIRQAAQLAIQHANEQGGYKGQKFELVIRSCDGPWGMTSKQTVALIYEDQVPIVVTALDGRNAHLAEQVTAKSHVVMLSTLSSDPTLSRAYVPWYFRMVPDDRQQAQALVEQIYEKDAAKKVAVFTLDEYDGKMSAEEFVKLIDENGIIKPMVFNNLTEEEMLNRIDDAHWDAVVFAGGSSQFAVIIQEVKNQNIYSFLNVFNFQNDYQSWMFTKIKYLNSEFIEQVEWEKFSKTHEAKYNSNPSPSLAFVYDGILLAAEAIKKHGPDPEAIRAGFMDLSSQGITGQIKFGSLGNREF